jgi:arylsulfatase A-like enzyme
MLEPVAEWIQSGDAPFLLIVLCSVTHDPYEVPEWFAKASARRFPESQQQPIQRYEQAVNYTDSFLAALDAKLAHLNQADNTILCIIGDHGEAFGEHGVLGHERVAFDEVYKVPWVLRAPGLVQQGVRIERPVSSVDVTPTLLARLGFDVEGAGFTGIDVLGKIPGDRRVYFCDWKHEGPAGYAEGNRKFIYYPATEAVSVYDLSSDPLELANIELPQEQADELAEQITTWRKSNVLRSPRLQPGRAVLFERWLCRWSKRSCQQHHPARNTLC